MAAAPVTKESRTWGPIPGTWPRQESCYRFASTGAAPPCRPVCEMTALQLQHVKVATGQGQFCPTLTQVVVQLALRGP